VIDPEDLLHYAARRINRTAISWAVIGGLAVSARTIPRFTQDLEGLIHHLTASGFRLITLLEQTATGRLATVRLAITSDTSERAVVDLLFASSGIESEVVAAATQVSLTPSLRLPVATIGHLIALKVLSRNDDTRPQDVIDLRNLMVEAAPDDLRLAEESLALISARGYDRGKNLRAEYEQLLARFRPTS
jgi:hypothetical protein